MPRIGGEFIEMCDADLKPGQIKGVRIGEKYYIAIINKDGDYYAVDDWCNHAGCLLSDGWLEAGDIVCPCHDASFDIKTGNCSHGHDIAQDQVGFETKVENGKVLIRFAESEMPY